MGMIITEHFLIREAPLLCTREIKEMRQEKRCSMSDNVYYDNSSIDRCNDSYAGILSGYPPSSNSSHGRDASSSTASVINTGTFARRANAIASLGRESIAIEFPFEVIQIFA